MKNSLRIHKWTHNEFNIFILGVLTHPLGTRRTKPRRKSGTARGGENPRALQ